LHDQRMPLGIRPITVMPNAMIFGTDWVLAGTNVQFAQKANNTAGNSLVMPCFAGGYTGRLVMAACGFLDKNTQDSRFTRIKYADAGGGFAGSTFIALAHANMNGSGSNQFRRRVSGVPLNFQGFGLPMFAAGPIVQPNLSLMGPPIWTNG